MCHGVVQGGKVLCFIDDIMMIFTSEYEIKREYSKKKTIDLKTNQNKKNKGCLFIQMYSITHHQIPDYNVSMTMGSSKHFCCVKTDKYLMRVLLESCKNALMRMNELTCLNQTKKKSFKF